MASIKTIVKDPISSSDIDYYLPHSKILQYKELRKYRSIEELLPKIPDYAFILYEDSPQSGHWTTLTRDIHNNLNYFDSYGYPPDHPLTWYSTADRIKLKENVCYLSHLLNSTPETVYYNDTPYQKNGGDVATCGRHAAFYVMTMLKYNMSLQDYKNFMDKMRLKHKKGYDEIVATYIDIM